MAEIRKIHESKPVSDEGQKDVIDVLMQMLARARAGELQSVYVVAMLANNAGIATKWAWTTGKEGGPTEMSLHLIALHHDILNNRS